MPDSTRIGSQLRSPAQGAWVDPVRPCGKGRHQAHRPRRVRGRPGRTPTGRAGPLGPQPRRLPRHPCAGRPSHPMEQDLRVLPVPVERESDRSASPPSAPKPPPAMRKASRSRNGSPPCPPLTCPCRAYPRDRTLRFFQIEGDSMLPIPSGSWILCTYVERLADVGSGRPYIVATGRRTPLQTSRIAWTWKAISGWSPTIPATPRTRSKSGRSREVARDWLVLNRLAGRIRQPTGPPKRRLENGRPNRD